jgi:hypothetical protein
MKLQLFGGKELLYENEVSTPPEVEHYLTVQVYQIAKVTVHSTRFFPATIKNAKGKGLCETEQQAQESGRALTPIEFNLAQHVGAALPEEIPILSVPRIPLPAHPRIKQLGIVMK